MPKKVKTRKQKMQADLRRSVPQTVAKEADSTTYSIPVYNQAVEPTAGSLLPSYLTKSVKTHTTSVEFSYLQKDLLKTLMLTCSIVIAELTMKFLLKI